MPQWAGSCWYYLRYTDPKNAEAMIGEDASEYWGVPDPTSVEPSTSIYTYSTLVSGIYSSLILAQ